MSESSTIVLITGANQGLGLEVVKKLAAEQEDYVILLGSRDMSRGEKAAAGITKVAKGTKVVPLQLDVSSDDSIERAAARVEKEYGRLDVLLNNAAVGQVPGAKMTRAEISAMFDVNLIGSNVTTDTFVPLLEKSPFPRLLFMSSDLGSISRTVDPADPNYGLSVFTYKASKAALNMLGAMYSVKYGKQGWRVNLVNPGFRATNLTQYSKYAGKAEDGALEACRVITASKDDNSVRNGGYTEIEGSIAW